MTIEAAYDFLGSHELLVIATASADGVPHAAPSFYALDGRSILFTTSPSTHTGGNIAATGKAAVAAGDAPDPGQTWDDAKGIQIVGTVTQLSGDAAAAAADKLRANYSHLGDSILQSHFYRLDPTSVSFIHNAPDGDEEFEPLGVNWKRDTF
jgi:uncharacterized protein YhbP (UPF0306 family)